MKIDSRQLTRLQQSADQIERLVAEQLRAELEKVFDELSLKLTLQEYRKVLEIVSEMP